MRPRELALMLKDWRAEHGISQREAGHVLGVSGHTVGGWEKEECLPLPRALAAVRHRLTQPVDAAAVRRACQRPPLIEPELFSARLRAWRQRHGIAQHQAAHALGVNVRTIVAWETLTQFPWRPLLARILVLLEAPPAVLVGTHGWHVRAPGHRDPQRKFGKQLRAWRKARGMNQLAACIALGLPRDQALISDWERGKALPKPERLAAIRAVICR